MAEGSKRLFVGVELGNEIKTSIAQAVSILKARGWSCRWVPEENIHLTLRFLGDCSNARLQSVATAVSAAASQIEPFWLFTDDFGVFPKAARANVVWLGLRASPEIRALHSSLSRELQAIGFETESRPYAPHITFARLKKPTRVDLAPLKHVETGHQTIIDKMTLFSSRLTPEGAEHEIVMCAVFGQKNT